MKSLSEENYLFEYNKRDVLEEVLRKTEKRLDAQLAVATAADQRAYAFCAVIFVVLAIAIGSVDGVNPQPIEVVYLVHFLIAACLAAWSGRPVDIGNCGVRSKTLANYRSDASCGYLPAALIDRNDFLIDHNNKIIVRSARIFYLALFFSGTGVVMLVGERLLPNFLPASGGQ